MNKITISDANALDALREAILRVDSVFSHLCELAESRMGPLDEIIIDGGRAALGVAVLLSEKLAPEQATESADHFRRLIPMALAEPQAIPDLEIRPARHD